LEGFCEASALSLFQKSWSNETTEYQSTTEYEFTSEVDYSEHEFLCEKGFNRSFRSWFLPTIYTIICLLALVGNVLVILTYLYFKRLKTMTDVYLLNLAMADLLFAISLPFWAASFMSKWHLGLYPCKAMFTIYKVSFFSGMFLLTCISVDRYFSITKAVCCSSLSLQCGLLWTGIFSGYMGDGGDLFNT